MRTYKNLKDIDLHEMIIKTSDARKQKFLDCAFDDTIIFSDAYYKIVSEPQKYFYSEFKWNFLNSMWLKFESNPITRIVINVLFLDQLMKLKFMRRWIFSYVSFDISNCNTFNINTCWGLYENEIKFPNEPPEVNSEEYLPVS